MELLQEAREEENIIKDVFFRFKKRNFTGTLGQAMKNSSYQLTQNLVFKICSLLFTIIIARLLLPDRMGLYNLALSTIILFVSFSDLGIGPALMTYIPRALSGKSVEKAKGYAKKLFQWKIFLVLITGVVLIIGAYFIAHFYYNKPIFYALLAGGIYIPISGMLGFVENMFKAEDRFKIPLLKEILFQVTRLIIVPLAILLFLKSGLSDGGVVAMTILALVASYSVALLYIAIRARKKIGFLQVKSKDLNKEEINDVKKFLYPLSTTALAGMFFGYIDVLMLGHFVAENYIAYYSAAFSLAAGATAIISFMSTALMPIFSRKTGKALEEIFRKTRNLTATISVLAGLFTYFVSWYVVRYTYGVAYLDAVPVLKFFSIMIALMPITALYRSYYTSQKKTLTLAYLLVGSAFLNIVLNIFGIIYGLHHYGAMGAIFGATIATIISRISYLIGLIVRRKK